MPQKNELQNDSFIQNISAIPMNPNHERDYPEDSFRISFPDYSGKSVRISPDYSNQMAEMNSEKSRHYRSDFSMPPQIMFKFRVPKLPSS
jgi:hypothetical protein